PTTGTFMLTEGERVDFNMYGNGVWANGSFSFYTFSASLVGNASTNYQENRSDAMYSSDQQTGNTQDSINLQETGGRTLSPLLCQWASGNGGGTLGGNRVSPSFGLIDPRNVFPARSGNPVNGGLGLGGEQQGQGGNGNGQGDNGGGGQGGGGQGDGSSLGSQSSGGGGGYSVDGLNGTQ